MENSTNVLSHSEVLQGINRVPEVNKSLIQAEIIEEENEVIVPSEAITMPSFITSKLNTPTKATLKNIIVSSQALQSTSIQQFKPVKEVPLWEKANKALGTLLVTVQHYAKEDWKLAFQRIGYTMGNSMPPLKVLINCISEELQDIAKANSWHVTHYKGNTYIYNGEFWVRVDRDRVIHFVRDISIKMGVKKYEAIGAKFGKSLYEQVIYSGMLVNKTNPKDELLLNMGNGTLSISNQHIRLRPFDHNDFLTYQLEFDYETNAVNHDWLDFLNKSLPDTDTQKTLQQALGYLLLRGLKLEKVILLYGTGANGKSVIFEVLKGLLSKESISNFSLNSLTDSKGYHRSYLKDKLINYASDIDLSKVDAGVFKALASGEPIEARLPYEDPIIMEDYAKLIFNLNDISTAKVENTHGFFRRFLFIPFNVTIPKSEQDKKLPQKLLQNKAGIFNWILDGAREVMINEDIYECPESEEFMLKFKQLPTPLEKFLQSYQVKADMQNTIQSSALYKYFEEMCIQDGVKAISNIKFSKQLEEMGYTKNRETGGMMWDVSLNS